MEKTLRDIIDDPTLTGGSSFEVRLFRRYGPDAMTDAEVRDLIESHPDVSGHLSTRWLLGHVVGGSDAVFLGAMEGGDPDRSRAGGPGIDSRTNVACVDAGRT